MEKALWLPILENVFAIMLWFERSKKKKKKLGDLLFKLLQGSLVLALCEETLWARQLL